MPDLIVNEMPCSVGLKALDEGISQRVKDYANSDNPLSLLIAARTEIANAKSGLTNLSIPCVMKALFIVHCLAL